MQQKVFILGASGNVGEELVKQIHKFDGKDKNRNPTEIIGMANSKNYYFDPRGINKKLLKTINSKENFVKNLLKNSGEKYKQLEDFIKLIQNEGLDGEIIFVDVTAGKKDLLNFHKQIITQTNNKIVTANKNPISLYSVEDFKILTGEYGRYGANTTVMGGAGILNFIDERNSIHDKILKIEGVFSGTLGYIMSELDNQEKSFSEIVAQAKKLGYTEPNPWDDLNGLDVARKLVILARYAGHNVNVEDIEIQPLIDEKYGKVSEEDFLEKIKQEDENFNTMIAKAKENGNVLRYVGEMNYNPETQKLTLKVGLKEVPKFSSLGNLKGTSNLAIVETPILAESMPHIIQSRGAGLAVTAGAVRADIAKMLNPGLKKF